jgi:hypothetical protein
VRVRVRISDARLENTEVDRKRPPPPKRPTHQTPPSPFETTHTHSAASTASTAAAAKRVLVVGGTGRVGGSTVRALKALGKSSPLSPPLALSVGGRSEENFELAKQRWAALDPSEAYGDVGFVSLDHEDPAALVAALAAAKPDLIVHTAGACVGAWLGGGGEGGSGREEKRGEVICFQDGTTRVECSSTYSKSRSSSFASCTAWAGPFQRRKAPEVLKAALALKTHYLDVCVRGFVYIYLYVYI